MFSRYLAITAFGLLIHLIGIGWGQIQSPCSDIFQYVRDGSTGEIEGQIGIQRVPQGVALHIMISLSIGVALPTKYVGKLELATSREQAIDAIRQGRPLIYRVRFPIQRPVPLVTRIVFNNMEYCSGRRAIGSIVTSITLEHTLFPPGTAPQMSNSPIQVPIEDLTPSLYSNQNRLPQVTPMPVSSTHNRPSQTPNVIPAWSMNTKPSQKPNVIPAWSMNNKPFQRPDVTPEWSINNRPTQRPNVIPASTTEFQWNLPSPQKPIVNGAPPRDSVEIANCGRPRKNEINLLISKGDRTQPGDWPWLVAIFVSRVKLEFQCAGSLLTDKHVLTAAHCLKSGANQELPASTLLAVVGRYKLRGWSERGSVTYEVSEFRIHAEYGRVGVRAGFDGDLAVMTLMETVTFGKLIMPVCLWSGPSEVESVVGKTGFVVGWGRDERGNAVTEEPRVTQVPIVSQEQCLRSNADFVGITSNRTFCGGGRDGGGPCNGDSGSGLVLYDPQNQRYHIRGVVSLSLLDRSTGSCDLSQYVVYTDVAKYKTWIQQQIST